MKEIVDFPSMFEKNTIHFIESNGLSVWWRDLVNNVCWVSNKTAQLCGYTQEVLIETPNLWEEIIFPNDKIIFEEALEKCLAGYSTDVEYRVIHSDGRIRWIQDRANPTKDENGKVISITSLIFDSTDKQTFQNKRFESEQRYKSLFENNADSVFAIGLNNTFTSCNKICEKLTGYSESELLALHYLSIFVTGEKLKVIEHFEGAKKGTTQNFRTSIRHKNGSIIELNMTIIPIMVNGQVDGVFGIAQDITKQVESEKANNHLAFHDYLTGLPNRSMLDKQLSQELLVAAERSHQVALLFIDLDRFKVINDTLSHTTGDYLLKEVAKRLTLLIRKNDFVFRQGGDEFIIILRDADSEVATKVAQRIVNTLSKPFTIQNEEIYTSPSIGISLYPEDGPTADMLIKHADIAMYQAKKAGKKNYKFFSSEQKGIINPLKLELDLHKAIENNEFLLYYQPKVNLNTGQIVGFEALIRWNHPELGMVSPNTFIPIAEETGLIIPIGKWALYEACIQNIRWHQKGLETVVSVNLSARQFTQSNMVQTIAEVLHKTRLKPQFLEIEITESMTADSEYTISTLQQLKYLGVRVSIDDFGTGFSSLNYLKQFPVDTLKIDQSFIQELHKNPSDETIVKTIISMAHNLNLNVVAEGIETREQLVFLQQHLCNDGQGYFFSKPLPVNELEEKLQEIEQIVKRYGLSEDINNNIWNEELLRIAKKDLKDTVRLQQGMITKFKNINGNYIYTLCDGELLYRLGFTPDQVVGKKLNEFIPENIAKKVIGYYQKAWETEEQVTFENEINGIHYLASLRPIKRGGEVVEVIGSYIDITDRIKAREALKESEDKYRLIAENMTDLIGIIDINGNVLFASPSVEHVLGFSPEYYKATNAFDNVHPEDVESLSELFSEMIQSKKTTQIECRYLHRNGNWVVIEANWTPVIGNNSEVEHFIVVARDVTEKRNTEELLRKSETLTVIGQLAAGMAHEIRNPITSIKGFIQLFKQEVMKQEFFDIISSEFDRLENIIKEFLSLAKPQQTQLKIVNLKSLFEEIDTLLEPEALLRNVQVVYEIKENPQIVCDPNQLKQVFINLIKNSMDATLHGGKINIKLSTEENNLLIKVIDHGIGISEERLKKLGEPFFSNKEKGTGLGLMFCFRTIREHKGTITFKSKENQGTTVEVRLPI